MAASKTRLDCVVTNRVPLLSNNNVFLAHRWTNGQIEAIWCAAKQNIGLIRSKWAKRILK